MKFVATKTAEQLDLQALHRVRERLVSQRTGIINQIRAFMLERGIAVRQGIGFLRTELPTILATRTDALSPRMLRVIEELAGDWRRLDQRIDGLSGEIEALARQRSGMFTPDDGARHRTDHFERHGGRDRHWRRILQTPRYRRLARIGAQADLDRRPHDPRQNLQARQLAELRRAELVTTRRQAKQVFYNIADQSVELCVRSIEAVFGAGNPRVALQLGMKPLEPRPRSESVVGAANFVRIL
jgi:hypothetical protein